MSWPTSMDPNKPARVLAWLIMEVYRRDLMAKLCSEMQFAELVPGNDIAKKPDQSIITGVLAHFLFVFLTEPEAVVDLVQRALPNNAPAAGADRVKAALSKLANTGKST